METTQAWEKIVKPRHPLRNSRSGLTLLTVGLLGILSLPAPGTARPWDPGSGSLGWDTIKLHVDAVHNQVYAKAFPNHPCILPPCRKRTAGDTSRPRLWRWRVIHDWWYNNTICGKGRWRCPTKTGLKISIG